MALNDTGPDDWISVPSARLSTPASGPDDWVPVNAPQRAPAPVRPTGAMPPVQALDDWVPINSMGANSISAPNGEQTESGSGMEVDALRPIGRYALELGKGAVEGFKNLGASSLKGHGAVMATAPAEQVRRQLVAIDRIDKGEAVPELDDLLGYQHMDPALRAKTKAELQNFQPTKVSEHPLYKAGEAVENFGKEALAPAPGFEGGWTRDIGGGLGSVGGGIALSMIPVAGPTLAGTTFISSGQGEAAERAVKAGATEQQIGQAARLGSIAGATDVVDALLPALGSTGRVLGFLKRVGYAVVVDALAEGGQEGVQQVIQNAIAMGVYKPDQDLMEDVPRNVAVGAIVGGGVGGLHGSLGHGDQQHAPAQPITSFETDRGATSAASVLGNSPTPPPDGLAAGYNSAMSVLGGPAPNPAAAPAPAPAAPVSQPPVAAAMEPALQTAPAASTAPLNGQAPSNNVSRETQRAIDTASLDTAPPIVQPQTQVQGVPLPASDQTTNAEATPAPARNRFDLQALLDDPRSAAEIKAEMEAARAFAPTDDWQSVPQGANLDPTLEFRTADGVRQARIAPAPGTRAAPVELLTPDDVHAGAEITNPTPTPAQTESGIYQKRHLKWAGLDISVETEAGAERVAKDGSWSVTMPVPYGQILGTKGADGDPVDISLGPNPLAKSVFIFDQIDPDTGKFDEHKVFQGFNSENEARQAYEASFSDGSGYLRAGAITEMPVSQFKRWVRSESTQKALNYEPKRAYLQPKQANAQPSAPKRGPLSLFEHLAGRGGLKPDPEIRAIFDQRNPFIPGFGRLIRPAGRSLDHAREGAVEAGYLRDTPFEGGLATSTVRDLLDAITHESGGNKVFSEHDLAEVAQRQAVKADKAERAHRKEIETDVRARAKQIGIAGLTDEEVRQAVDHVLTNGSELEEAIVDVAERAAMAGHGEMIAFEQETPHGDAAARTRSVSERPDEARQRAGGAVARAAQGGPQARFQPAQAQPAAAPAEGAKAAENAEPVNKPIETFAGEDGMEARIFRNSDGRQFNITLHDKDADQTVGAVKIAPSLERARFIAKAIVKAPPATDKMSENVPAAASTEPAKPAQNIPQIFRPKRIAPQPAEKPAETAPPEAQKTGSESAPNPEIAKTGEGISNSLQGKPAANVDLKVNKPARPNPTAPDPLDLAMSGELTAERARQIAADLTRQEKAVETEIFGSRAEEWRKLHKQSDRAWDNADDAKAKALDARIAEIEKEVGLTEADENWLNGQGWDVHAVPDHWTEIARNLQDIENGREDAVAIAASEVRRLPKTNDWSKMYSGEREAVITILSAMNAEKAAGRDPKAFLKDVFAERIKRYGGGHDAHEVAQYQMQELADLLKGPITREGAAPTEAPAPPVFKPKRLKPAAASAATADIGETFSAVPRGWTEVGGMEAPRMSEAEIEQVREIVDRVAGIDPSFAETIPIPKDSYGAKQWGKTEDGNAQGFYSSRRDEIVVALDYGSPRAGYHEAFHRLQYRFLNEREKAVLASETRKLRDVLRKDLARKDSADKMSQSEVEAETFAIYAANRDLPINNIIKRAWNRMLRHLERLRNALHGLGYQTSEDIFERAKSGEINRRGERAGVGNVEPLNYSTENGADNKPQLIIPGTERMSDRELARRKALEAKKASRPQKDTDGLPLFGDSKNQGELFSLVNEPGKPDPVLAIPNEIIADRLEARNLPKLASLSRIAGIGKANAAEIRTQVQDKFIRWQHMQGAIEKATGEKLSEAMNVYQAESLYYGRAGQRLEALERNYIDPLIKEIRSAGLSLDDVNRFLMARHAPERNEAMKKLYDPSQDDMFPAGKKRDLSALSGMSNAEAKRILAEIDSGGKRQAYDAVEKRVRGLIDETRATLVSSGLISQETANNWTQSYQNYVPLRGFADETEAEAPMHGRSKGFDVRGPEAKRAMGRSSLADGPLAYTLLQAQQAVVRSEKERVVRAAARLVVSNPMPELWTIDTKGKTKREIDPATGLVRDVKDPAFVTADNVVGFKVKGEQHYIVFHGPFGKNLARALKNLGTSNLHPAFRMIATLTRLQARLATSWNPDFMIPNFVRDFGEAFINLQAQDQKKFVRLFVKHLMPSMGGAFLALAGKKGGKYAQYFREFDEDGGRIRFFGMEDVEDIKSAIASKMRRLEGGVVNNLRHAGEKALEAVEIANGSIENATRLAAYIAAREVGMSRTQAASLARELTVNFNKKGELGGVISGLYMFANAAMQGTTRMIGAMGNKRVRRAAYGLAASGFALSLFNFAAGGDDDDDTPHYLKIPHWIRDSNLILMWPKGMGHDGQYVKLPLPYGYSPFKVIGDRLAGMIFGKEDKAKATAAIASSVLDAFDPLGKDNNLLAQFTPTLARPAVHIGTNQNWTGRAINPDAAPWNKHEPDASRYFRSASPFAIWAAGQMNEASGGGKHHPGFVDVSPGTVDYMLRFVTGGLGQFANNSATTVLNGYNGQEWQVDKTPILRRFYGKPDFNSDRALYYDERKTVETTAKQFEAYQNEGTFDQADRILKKGAAEIDNAEAFKRYDKEVKSIQKEIDEIKANKEMSPRERERRIKLKEREEIDVMRDARKGLAQDRKREAVSP